MSIPGLCHHWLPAFLVHVCLVSGIHAQDYARPAPGTGGYRSPATMRAPAFRQRVPVRVAERAAENPNLAQARRQPQKANEHPLMPALRWAAEGLREIEKLEDYSATMVKRERLGGEVGEHEYMFIKVRQKPFSVYTYFLGPRKLQGQEALYVEGKNDGNI